MKTRQNILNVNKYLLISLIFISSIMMSGCTTKGNDTLPRQMEKPEKGDEIAIIKTSEGEIRIKLLSDVAPKTVEAFKQLVNRKYYENMGIANNSGANVVATVFEHDEALTTEVIGKEYIHENADDVRHYSGAVGMLKYYKKDATTGFYINATAELDQSYLEGLSQLKDMYSEEVVKNYGIYGGDPRGDVIYTVFAHVYEGQEIVDEIFNIELAPYTLEPERKVTIESIEIKTYDGN